MRPTQALTKMPAEEWLLSICFLINICITYPAEEH